eukprot:gene37875-46009_t
MDPPPPPSASSAAPVPPPQPDEPHSITASSAKVDDQCLDAGDFRSNPPQAIYQMVTMELDLEKEYLQGHTVIWLSFREPVKKGFVFRLHSRYHHILEVTVNNVQAQYVRKDGLRNLSGFTKKKMYSGLDMDLSYRAALEISREGELEITVPSLESAQTLPPKPIPRASSKTVIQHYDRVLRQFRQLTAPRESVYDLPEDMKDTSTQLLQVKIRYALTSGSGGVSCPSLVFRRQTPLVKQMDRGAKKSSVVCVYTSINTSTTIHSPDNIRCWLPVLDFADQQCVYDLSISVMKNYNVVCAGTKLPFPKVAPSTPKTKKRVHRFFTAPLPAFQLGFFVGRSETYKMALYRVRGKVWVATGLVDYLSRGDGEEAGDKASENLVPEEGAAGNAEKPPSISLSNKRPREEEEKGSEESTKKIAKVGGDVATDRRPLPPTKPHISYARRLYTEAVQHTMLGLELAFRLLHKFTGH